MNRTPLVGFIRTVIFAFLIRVPASRFVLSLLTAHKSLPRFVVVDALLSLGDARTIRFPRPAKPGDGATVLPMTAAAYARCPP